MYRTRECRTELSESDRGSTEFVYQLGAREEHRMKCPKFYAAQNPAQECAVKVTFNLAHFCENFAFSSDSKKLTFHVCQATSTHAE